MNATAPDPKNAALIFERVEQVPAYRKICTALENLIYSGDLKPGAILPSEQDLADRFGVTRSTVREGIRLLEQGGLVERPSPKRMIVARPQLAGLASQVGRALLMHEVTFSELWETLCALEPATAALAARRATPELIAQLESNVARMRTASDVARFMELDVEFHELLGKAAANRAMILARESVALLIERSGLAVLPRLHTERRVVDIHAAILKAVKARDEVAAERDMRRHMIDFKRGYERAGFKAGERLVAG